MLEHELQRRRTEAKLEGHFVHKTDDGYALRNAGGRVVEAVLSGVVTETPVLERTPVETPCFLCGGQMAVSYREETVGMYCADCRGTRGEASQTAVETTDSADAHGPPASGGDLECGEGTDGKQGCLSELCGTRRPLGARL